MLWSVPAAQNAFGSIHLSRAVQLASWVTSLQLRMVTGRDGVPIGDSGGWEDARARSEYLHLVHPSLPKAPLKIIYVCLELF